MSFPRLDHATHIADRLNELATVVKTRSRANLTDANRILETIARRFFNALFGWDLVNLNIERSNFPAADLGDRLWRIAIQVTNEAGSDKIKRTTGKAIAHGLGSDFDRLIVFFLLSTKPGFPKNFLQPPHGPKIETWDIADLLKQLQELPDLTALAEAAKVLDEEMGKLPAPVDIPKFEISRIIKYASAELIGRSEETALLNDAWAKAHTGEPKRPRVLTFVALGGEGKTSLVAKWAAELAHQDWPGCDAAFAWSFYSQGTREQVAASSDLFLKEALTFFGGDADKEFAASPAGAFEKGQRLARIVGQRRSLLILDGLEPLQYAPTSPTPGQLKDQGLAALLKGLATASHGLCVVTTRYSLPDLRAFWQTTAPEVKLLRLSRDAGVHLLQSFGVKGSLLRNLPFHREQVNEFEKLVEDVRGHALTLNLLGTYLRDAHAGDIRKRDLVKLEEADAEEQGGHAFRVMEAYEREFEREGDKGQRALAVLRLLGLFDRPVTADCLGALLQAPAIPRLTKALVGLTEAQRNLTFKRLENARLLTVNYDASGALDTLDTHPLLREYFARQLRENQSDAWREAHRRLYEHLCANTQEGDEPTLEELQPLFQAVAHGCQAGLQQRAHDEVHLRRVRKGGQKDYCVRQLGAWHQNLGALTCFFERPWSQPSRNLREQDQAILLGNIALHLGALGRIREAIEPVEASLHMGVQSQDWFNATTRAARLSELELVLGTVAAAIGHADLGIVYAERSSDVLLRIASRATRAHALHQAGSYEDSHSCFRDAEAIQIKHWSREFPKFYSLQGFWFTDLLLRQTERNVWLHEYGDSRLLEDHGACDGVLVNVRKTLDWIKREQSVPLLTLALTQLMFGRAAFYAAILSNDTRELHSPINSAVESLRLAGDLIYLPLGLLTRAWLRCLHGQRIGVESAQADLDQAWEIAERGPMKLFLADIHLHRARLFFREAKYPWVSPQADLAAAEKLIKECGYRRRDEELADAQAAILGGA